jgi:TPR repeat protein
VFEKNPSEALKWWRKAAEQGQPSAQFNLGQTLLEGKSVTKDLVEAYKWFSLAAEQGDRDARRTRDALAVELEPADVAEGLRRAREFKTGLRAKLREEREKAF